jgi:hypothetical protein
MKPSRINPLISLGRIFLETNIRSSGEAVPGLLYIRKHTVSPDLTADTYPEQPYSPRNQPGIVDSTLIFVSQLLQTFFFSD